MQKEVGPIGRLRKDEPICIIGAGVSGLLIAHYLKKYGHEIKIFERDKQIGGKIRTLQSPAGLVETAANAIYTNNDVVELIEELGLSPLEPTLKLKKKIWWEGAPKTFPFSLKLILRFLYGLTKKTPHYTETMSVYDYFRPLLTDRYSHQILSAILGGIYAIDSKELSIESLFPSTLLNKRQRYFSFFKYLLKQKKQSAHKSISMSFPNGMSDFIEALRKNLKDNIVIDSHYSKLSEGANVIICTNAQEAADILESSGQGNVANELRKITYQSISTTTFFTKKPIPSLDKSFGILFPPKSGFNSNGILHNSAIFNFRTVEANQHSYTFISPKEVSNIEEILVDLNRISSSPYSAQEITTYNITYWKNAIPKYNRERLLALKHLRIMMHDLPVGIVLFGNYVDGISIREMIAQAKLFAQKYSYAKVRK